MYQDTEEDVTVIKNTTHLKTSYFLKEEKMKKGKRIIAVLAVALLVLGIGIPAAPVKAADDTVYEFDIDFPNPETASAYKALVDWAAYLDEKSDGRIKMNIYSGGALGALPDCVVNCESGVTDGFWSGVTIYPGVFPATEVLALPMIGAKNFKVVNDVLNALLADYDVISNEWSQFKVIALHSSAGSPILFADEVESVKDMAGKDLRISNAYTTEWFKAKGANPVSVGINDGYENIQKGVIKGGLFFFDQVESSALYEVIKTLYVGQSIYPLNMLCLNLDKYNELPDDLKAIIDESGEFFLETSIDYFDEQQERMIKVCEDAGVKIIYEDEDSIAWLADGAEKGWEKWVDTINGQGLPGQEIFDKAQEYIEKFNAEYED
jgi:TRAP-type C4-dicarboxylate transport system substrate-binding protein